jgi:4-hydroxy-3-methylbut-2-enyl diphosphate reductase
MAVKTLSEAADLILVVGAQNSSNSNRLVEVARGAGVAAYLIATVNDIQDEWLGQCCDVGVTAGASTPEILVQEVINDLKARGFMRVEELELIPEDVHFPLPAPLEKFERALI